MAERLQIGRYEVLSQLSKGGMAELFLACIMGPAAVRRLVALKRILPSLKDEEEFIAMFLNEARISASLSHANIAQVFELGEVDGEFFLALEFIAGQDLGRIARQARSAEGLPPVGFSAAIARDLALGLNYAHTFTTPAGETLPIVHRDIKLSNVMVTYDGCAKIIDFGIAKARGTVSATEVGRVKGTLAFMSPEQIRGEDLDGRSDLFSLGAVLYELLTGKRAFAGSNEGATMYRVLTLEPPPPETIAPVPPELSAVVMRAIEKDPAARFQTGADFAAALERAVPLDTSSERARWMLDSFADELAEVRTVFAAAESPDTEQLYAVSERLGARVGSERGSSVTFTLSPNEATRQLTPPAPRLAHDSTVLVVDDTRVGRLVVKSVLAAEGFRVVEAASGEEALEILEQLKPDLIILDVRMPGIDGFETCRRARGQPKLRNCPIIFLSAECGIDERSKGLEVGADDFIRKPFESSDLLTRVRTYLQRSVSFAERLPPLEPRSAGP